jgi:hypothetical protein
LIIVRSVFRLGIVQFSFMAVPARVADKSRTTPGKPSEGGWGAPGVPHPEKTEQAPRPRAAHAAHLSEAIAVSLMDWQSQGIEVTGEKSTR